VQAKKTLISAIGSTQRMVGPDPLIGRYILDSYELVQLLATGGMCSVYQARHRVTEQQVAVKVLPPELSRDQDVRRRFIEEARTLGRLNHPNIVFLHGFAEEEEHLYLIMQFVPGRPLSDRIATEGALSLAEALQVGIQVLHALEYAHAQDVIHRDIKPANIMVESSGELRVKVMDFGLARIVGTNRLTQAGKALGTVRYMSPEQVRGKDVDRRTDIYSLGLVLYEALTGVHPYSEAGQFEAMKAHLTRIPQPPSTLRLDLSSAVDQVVARATEKRAEQRYQTTGEFRVALEMLSAVSRSGSGPGASQSGPRSHRRGLGAAVAAAALLAVALGLILWSALVPGRMTSAAGDHPLVVRLNWQTWIESIGLRVLSTEVEGGARFPARVDQLRRDFQPFVRDRKIPWLPPNDRLTIARVPASVLNDRALWRETKPGERYLARYLPHWSTLFVGPEVDEGSRHLIFGVAMHQCGSLKLSDVQCEALASDFERAQMVPP
jgi:tRNA A-37 threonylcarbamoyl transferase component Bud32